MGLLVGRVAGDLARPAPRAFIAPAPAAPRAVQAVLADVVARPGLPGAPDRLARAPGAGAPARRRPRSAASPGRRTRGAGGWPSDRSAASPDERLEHVRSIGSRARWPPPGAPAPAPSAGSRQEGSVARGVGSHDERQLVLADGWHVARSRYRPCRTGRRARSPARRPGRPGSPGDRQPAHRADDARAPGPARRGLCGGLCSGISSTRSRPSSSRRVAREREVAEMGRVEACPPRMPMRRAHRATASSADVPVALDEVLERAQLAQADRPAGVQLLGRVADLGAHPELAAVGEARRGVDVHAGRVDAELERARGGRVAR